MDHLLLADLVKWFHVLWIVALLSCCVLQVFSIRLALLTGLLGAATCVSQIIWGSCPLTVLEERLRKNSETEVQYGNEFIVFYLREWFGLDVAPTTIIALNVALVLCSTLLVMRLHRYVFKRIQQKKNEREA